MSSSSTSPAANPFAWLGLLKWSLAYSDGTRPSDPNAVSPLSAEHRAFLEAVMRDGVIDEGERMKSILKQVIDQLETWKVELEQGQASAEGPEDTSKLPVQQQQQQQQREEEITVVLDLLQELRDIVEQIDYARAFCALQGLPFLLGCIQSRSDGYSVPRSIRIACLGLLSTLCQHNPPVQEQLLHLGSIRILSELYMIEEELHKTDDVDGQVRARIMQAISANVRSHALAESVFCGLQEQAVSLLLSGLGARSTESQTAGEINSSLLPPLVVRKRALFFLHALVTSDDADRQRVRLFAPCIAWVTEHNSDWVGNDDSSPDLYDSEVREMSLMLIEQILEQHKSVDIILERKELLLDRARRRIALFETFLTGTHEWEEVAVERQHWERISTLLEQASPDSADAPAPSGGSTTSSAPLLLGGPNVVVEP